MEGTHIDLGLITHVCTGLWQQIQFYTVFEAIIDIAYNVFIVA